MSRALFMARDAARVLKRGAWIGSEEQTQALRQCARDFDWNDYAMPIFAWPERFSPKIHGISECEAMDIHDALEARVAEELALAALRGIAPGMADTCAVEALVRFTSALTTSAHAFFEYQCIEGVRQLHTAIRADGDWHGHDGALEIETIAEQPRERGYRLHRARFADGTSVLYVSDGEGAVPVTASHTSTSIAAEEIAWVFPGVDMLGLVSGGAS